MGEISGLWVWGFRRWLKDDEDERCPLGVVVERRGFVGVCAVWMRKVDGGDFEQ